MTAANLCEQCKAHGTPSRSRRESPSGSSNRSSARMTSSTPQRGPGPCPLKSSKPVYVRMDLSEKTCIVLGKSDGCGGGNISLQLPSSPGSNKLRLQCGGGSGDGSGRSRRGNCIEIMGNSIITSARGGLQIVSGKGKGGMQISLGKGGCPVLQLGGTSARSRGTTSGSMGGVQVCPGGSGQLQLNFGKSKCGDGPSIICGPNGSNMQISYGPQKRKLDMNHCKPTVAYMIHKRLVELETELRMAECSYSDLHP